MEPFDARPAARTRRDSGFTLMELMVTMTIAAGLMSMGIGLFVKMGKRTAAENALASVSSLVVNVRNASSRFPAAIRVDPEENIVQSLAQEVRQELHFDPRPAEGGKAPVIDTGIEGRECQFLGNTVDPKAGRIGGALLMNAGKVDCGQYAAYDVTDGLTVELYIKPQIVGSAELVTKGDALSIHLEGGGRGGNSLRVRLAVKDEHGAEKVTADSAPFAVRANEWLGIRVSYNANTIKIETDQGYGFVQRGSKAETRRLVPSPDANLMVGGFQGWLDDFRFAGVQGGEPIRMPDGVRLEGKTPFAIHFAGGRLDPNVHMGVQSIAIDHAGRATVLEIATNGMLSVAYRDLDQPAQSKQPDDEKLPKKE